MFFSAHIEFGDPVIEVLSQLLFRLEFRSEFLKYSTVICFSWEEIFIYQCHQNSWRMPEDFHGHLFFLSVKVNSYEQDIFFLSEKLIFFSRWDIYYVSKKIQEWTAKFLVEFFKNSDWKKQPTFFFFLF